MLLGSPAMCSQSPVPPAEPPRSTVRSYGFPTEKSVTEDTLVRVMEDQRSVDARGQAWLDLPTRLKCAEAVRHPLRPVVHGFLSVTPSPHIGVFDAESARSSIDSSGQSFPCLRIDNLRFTLRRPDEAVAPSGEVSHRIEQTCLRNDNG